jgi:hypothetical protein
MDIPLISFLSSIMSRLSYFDNNLFLDKYLQIFDIQSLKNQLVKLKNKNITNIFDVNIKNRVNITKNINHILYDNTILDKEKIITSENVQYILINTSNYSNVYVVANKELNTIFVCFRGTYSLKSAQSYLQLWSITPTTICEDSDDGYLLGVFKIVFEIFYTIKQSIHYLSTHFFKNNSPNIITTGHSLGGACSSIFSYLWVKHASEHKIGCIIFGSPRTMNLSLIKKYCDLITEKRIMFRRYITNGDPFAILPITSKKMSESYYFPDDYDPDLDYVSIRCNNTLSKTSKLICRLKNKTKRKPLHVKYHGIYLGILYKGAAGNKLDLNREIKRNEIGNTICRVIINGNNKKTMVSFFDLQEAKESTKNTSLTMSKIKKMFISDYKHQDIYITKDMFQQIIDDGYELDENDLNPLSTDKYIKIQHKIKNQNILCI